MIKGQFHILSVDMIDMSIKLKAVTNQMIYQINLSFFGANREVIHDNFALDKEYELTIKEVDTNE